MIVSGVLAAAVLAVPGVLTAIAAVLLIQVQILLDCVDGELARWRRRFSPTDRVCARGIYLDHLGHYLTGPLLAVGLGIRADGGWNSIGPYTAIGLVAAFLALFVSASGALVYLTRAESGLGLPRDRGEIARSRSSLLQRARRAAGRMPFYRALVAMEFTVLALAAAVVDAIAGDRVGSRALVLAMIPVAALTVLGRLAAILTSDRLC
jgi:phosphatidylglycerophosphate synthase